MYDEDYEEDYYSSYEWQELKERVFAEWDGICAFCGDFVEDSPHVHHLYGLSSDACAVLCPWCHAEYHGDNSIADCRKKPKPCKYCGKPIRWKQENDKWIPIDAKTKEEHNCRKDNTMNPQHLPLFRSLEEKKKQSIESGRLQVEIAELTARLAHIRENLELAETQFINNPASDNDPAVEKKMDKFNAWLSEYYDLVVKLDGLGVKREGWHCARCGSLVAAYKGQCDRCGRPEEKHFFDALGRRGWVALECSALGGEIIVVVRLRSVSVPPDLAGRVRYTFDELVRLKGMPPEELLAAHQVKKEIGGRVVD